MITYHVNPEVNIYTLKELSRFVSDPHYNNQLHGLLFH